MGKIIVDYDIKTAKVEFYINNFKIEDVFSIFLHRDITNGYKYTLEIVSDEGRTTIKNGEVKSDKNANLFIEKFLSLFENMEQK